MRRTSEALYSYIRYDVNGILITERPNLNEPKREISNFGGITVVVRLNSPDDLNDNSFTVAYAKTNTGSALTKPEQFITEKGREEALKHLNNPESNQRFTFTHPSLTLEQLKVSQLMQAVKELVLNQQVGENVWLFADTRLRDVVLPFAELNADSCDSDESDF